MTFISRAFIAFVCVIASACAPPNATPPDSQAVTVTIENASKATLECRLIYGHWVERDLGQVLAGAKLEVPLSRQDSDGSLYTMRPDGKMRMMLETVICVRLDTGWRDPTRIDLLPLRGERGTSFGTTCTGADPALICTRPEAD